MRGRTRKRRARADWWAKLSDERLLDLRFCDLKLTLGYPPLARAMIAQRFRMATAFCCSPSRVS